MKLGTSPITGEIYLGKTRRDKNGLEIWVGAKTDITDNAISCVAERMMYLARESHAVQQEFTWGDKCRLTLTNQDGLKQMKTVKESFSAIWDSLAERLTVEQLNEIKEIHEKEIKLLTR